MKFKYKGTAYESLLKCNGDQIVAICDTGATVTSLDIYSISKLVNHTPEEIYKDAVERLERNKVALMHTASGKFDRAIYIELHLNYSSKLVVQCCTVHSYYVLDGSAFSLIG